MKVPAMKPGSGKASPGLRTIPQESANGKATFSERHLPHAIREAFLGETPDILDNAAACDPRYRGLDDDTRPGEDRVEELLTAARLLALELLGTAWSGFLPAHTPASPSTNYAIRAARCFTK